MTSEIIVGTVYSEKCMRKLTGGRCLFHADVVDVALERFFLLGFLLLLWRIEQGHEFELCFLFRRLVLFLRRCRRLRFLFRRDMNLF